MTTLKDEARTLLGVMTLEPTEPTRYIMTMPDFQGNGFFNIHKSVLQNEVFINVVANKPVEIVLPPISLFEITWYAKVFIHINSGSEKVVIKTNQEEGSSLDTIVGSESLTMSGANSTTYLQIVSPKDWMAISTSTDTQMLSEKREKKK